MARTPLRVTKSSRLTQRRSAAITLGRHHFDLANDSERQIVFESPRLPLFRGPRSKHFL